MMTRLKFKAASEADVMITEMVDGLIITRPAKKFQEITEAKMAKKIAI